MCLIISFKQIRSAFARIIVLLAHLTRADGIFSIELFSSPLEPWQGAIYKMRYFTFCHHPLSCTFFFSLVNGCDPTKSTLSDYLLRTVIEILHRDSGDNVPRHMLQYFQLFVMYAGIGIFEVCFLHSRLIHFDFRTG